MNTNIINTQIFNFYKYYLKGHIKKFTKGHFLKKKYF